MGSTPTRHTILRSGKHAMTYLPRVILRKILSESMMRRFAVIIVATNIMRYLIILYLQ